MSLLPQSTVIAAEIDQIHRETISFLRAQALRSFALVNTTGLQQAIMQDLGPQAAHAVQTYGVIHAALASLGQADGLTAPNPDIFQIQEDGWVNYVAPPEPDPEPEEGAETVTVPPLGALSPNPQP